MPVHTIDMKRGISPLRDLVSIWRMVRLMISIRPDIVHSYTPKAGLICMVSAWLARVPVRVHTFTGLIWPTNVGLKRQLLINVDRLICSCATHVTPESQGVRSDLLMGKITSKPLNLLGYGNIAGIDVEYFSPNNINLLSEAALLKKTYAIKENDFVYIFIGRLNRDKGVEELLTAFELLPVNTRLLIAGDFDYTAPLRSIFLNCLQNHPRIHHLGFLQDVRPSLLLANVLVLPSYREGLPNVILQAGAMRIPVIASHINGCKELIDNDINGWLVAPRDASALADVMKIALTTSRVKLMEMGLSSRETIVRKFERSAQMRRLVEFYQSLVL